jgi:uncharacterized membrane protein
MKSFIATTWPSPDKIAENNSIDPDITVMINAIKEETLSHEFPVKQALAEEKKNG